MANYTLGMTGASIDIALLKAQALPSILGDIEITGQSSESTFSSITPASNITLNNLTGKLNKWYDTLEGLEEATQIEFNGTLLVVNSPDRQNVTAQIESTSSTAGIWQYKKNLLPPVEDFVLGGVNVTVENDGTFVFNGTTTGNGNKIFSMNNLPINSPHNVLTGHYGSWHSTNQAPNTSGYVLFKVLDDQNRNAISIGLNSSTALEGAVQMTNIDSVSYIKNFQIQFYSVPVGTVFNNWKVKIQLEEGESATAYAPPSLKYTEVSVTNGVASTSLELEKSRNHIITNADGLTFVARVYTATSGYVGKRWACFGDSLTQKDSSAIAAGQKRYFDIVAEQLGLSVVNYGRATTGYSTTGSVTTGQYYLRMQRINPELFDFMTIMGSTNDISGMAQGTIQLGDYDDTGTSTVCGCINTTLDYYYQLAPLKPIGMISMLPTYAYGPDLIDTTVAENYVNAQKQICANRGIPFLDLYHGSGMRPWDAAVKSALYIDGDGIHPNNDGIKWFAPMIREFVKSLM